MTMNAQPGLFDLFNKGGHEQKFTKTLDCLTAPTRTGLTADESCENDEIPRLRVPLIPPDLISVSTTTSGDDEMSFSSISSGGDSCERRSLFDQHWQKSSKKAKPKRTRPFPKTIIATRPCPFSGDSDDECSEDDKSGNTYEQTLRKQEGVKVVTPPGRRSIFGGCLAPQRRHSFNENCFAINPPMIMRQACSDSALIMKQLPSCLRPPKYSGDDPSRHIDRATPVSFSDSVTVIKYETPQEQWASSGWSSYFS